MKFKKPKCKRKKLHIQVINPLRKKCDCGRKVTDHHASCNYCRSIRDKERYWAKTRMLNKGFIMDNDRY